MRRTFIRSDTGRMCWLSCVPISTILRMSAGPAFPSRNSNISAPEIATCRVFAMTRATPMENIWDRRTVPPPTWGASSTVSSIRQGMCANSVKRWRTHRFRNWNGSHVRRESATTAGLRELGGAI